MFFTELFERILLIKTNAKFVYILAIAKNSRIPLIMKKTRLKLSNTFPTFIRKRNSNSIFQLMLKFKEKTIKHHSKPTIVLLQAYHENRFKWWIYTYFQHIYIFEWTNIGFLWWKSIYTLEICKCMRNMAKSSLSAIALCVDFLSCICKVCEHIESIVFHYTVALVPL